MSDPLAGARAVADAVLYEGYLLYPYRASSAKNAVRWQFGVLGPPDTDSQLGEPSSMHADVVVRGGARARLTLYLRFLQLRRRQVARAVPVGFTDVDELRMGAQRWLSWDEAMPHELSFGPFDLRTNRTVPVRVDGGRDVEELADEGALLGRVERRRYALRADLELTGAPLGNDLWRIGMTVTNTGRDGAEPPTPSAVSLLGAHLLLQADDATFVSLLEPPHDAVAAVAGCRHERCWPVLASADEDLMLVSPIILYDHPEVAPESAGELYDATEIDEILSLRVMTMTEEEKAEARATDPRAAAIIDRCDAMSPEVLTQLHGRLRNPHAVDPLFPAAAEDPLAMPFGADFDLPFSGGTGLSFSDADIPTFGDSTIASLGDDNQRPAFADTQGKPWWDPGVDGAVDPDSDRTVIDGVGVSRGSRVRVEPRRRADAQDMFFTGREATVAAVYADVDGGTHVAVVLTDDPAADVREWYGRYLYFAPDELVPMGADDLMEPLPGKEG